MSRTRRLLLAFGLYVLIPSLFQFIVQLNKSDQAIENRPIPSPTPSITQSTCANLRDQRNAVAKQEEIDRKAKLNAIYSLQKQILWRSLDELFLSKQLSKQEWSHLQYLEKHSSENGLPLFPLDQAYVNAENVFERLLTAGLISNYLHPDVVELGESLANSTSTEHLIVIQNKSCFSELDLLTAESITNLKFKSGWGRKQAASDFVEILSRQTNS